MLTIAGSLTLLASSGAAADTTAASTSPSAQTVRLTSPQMFELAELARRKGDLATAATIYEALERDPDADVRAEARFRHARQLITIGKHKDAALLLRRVIDERPKATAARLELARVLQLMGETEGALRELRAAQASGLPPAVARLIDRYSQALRATRPLGASLEIALAPDSNINHATSSSTVGTIFGDFDVDQESQARSGVGLSLRGQAFRRLALKARDDSILFRLSGFADIYRQARFNSVVVDAAAGPELRFGRNQLNLEAGVSNHWYGQKPYLRSARIAATLARALGARTQLRVSGSAARIDNRRNDLEDGNAFSARVGIERALSATTGVGVNLSASRNAFEDTGYSTRGWRHGVFAWRDFGRMTMTAEVDLGGLRADERLLLFPERRSDRYSRWSLAATFRQLQVHGFAPVVRFTRDRNRSSIEFYAYGRSRTEFAIVRAF